MNSILIVLPILTLLMFDLGLTLSPSDFMLVARRTIVIEVGMQNAAQAIAIASSPFVFNDGRMAIPAIIYALLMNVALLSYVAYLRGGLFFDRKKA